jgi:hypothetical protein
MEQEKTDHITVQVGDTEYTVLRAEMDHHPKMSELVDLFDEVGVDIREHNRQYAKLMHSKSSIIASLQHEALEFVKQKHNLIPLTEGETSPPDEGSE